jgi:WD40 repeat protein
MFTPARPVLGLVILLAAASAAAGQPGRVDAQGDPLPDGVVARLGTVRFRHGYPVYGMAYSPDGKRLASRASDGLRVWETATGKQCFVVPADPEPGSWFTDVTFAADGRSVAVCDDKGLLRIFDVATGKLLRSWRGHESLVLHVVLSADGKTLATAGRDRMVRVWDWQTGRERLAIGKPIPPARRDRENNLVACVLARDGKTLAVVGPNDHGIHLWDVEAGRETRHIPFASGFAPARVQFAADGKTLLTLDNRLQFWDTRTGKEAHPIPEPPGRACHATFSPDGKFLCLTCYTETNELRLHFFAWPSGQPVAHRLTGAGIRAMPVFAPDSRVLAIGRNDNVGARFFEWQTGKELLPPVGHTGCVRDLAFSPDGKSLFSAGDDTVRWWDVATAAERHRFAGHRQMVSCLALSADGKTLATGDGVPHWSGPGGTILVWDVPSRQQRGKIAAPDLWNIGSLAFAPDGQSLLSASIDGTWRLWGLPGGKELLRVANRPNNEYHNAARFVEDGRVVLSSQNQAQTLWDADGAERHTTAEPGGEAWNEALALAVMANGRWFAVCDRVGHVYLFETATGQSAGKFRAHREWATALAFSPDGRALASSSSAEPGAAVWDLATGRQLTRLSGHAGHATSLAFSPSGHLLATGGSDSSILLWDTSRFLPRGRRPLHLSLREQEALWRQLGGLDAAAALQAIWRLEDDPVRTVAFLGKKLQAIAWPAPQEVRGWVADLDGGKFAAREQALRKLKEAGWLVAAPLRRALAGSKSLESHRRITALLQWVDETPVPPELHQCRRALQILEAIGTAEARGALEECRRRGMADAASSLRHFVRREIEEP